MGKSLLFLCLMGYLQAQQQPAPALKERPEVPANGVQVDAGTHILLSMINSVSTKQAVVGDRIYLETAFPVVVNGKIVVPRGSWVTGTVTEVQRPKRVKGRGELAVRFDSLTLPNGATRSFRSNLGALDASNEGTLDHDGETGKVKGAGDKKTDAETVIRTTAEGAAIGTAVGAAAGHIGGGGLIGVTGGAAGGLIAVLASRGPDAVLRRGSTVEMVLDRALIFDPAELTGGAMDEEPIEVPVSDVLDLHTFATRDTQAAIEAYLEEANRKGLKALRIIHGRGIGIQRETVRKVLARTPWVVHFGDAPAEAGGWGATVVTLRATGPNGL